MIVDQGPGATTGLGEVPNGLDVDMVLKMDERHSAKWLGDSGRTLPVAVSTRNETLTPILTVVEVICAFAVPAHIMLSQSIKLAAWVCLGALCS